MPVPSASGAERKPNVLLIVTDQQRADHLGCYGNAVVRTPHIDGLARRGVRFERFYVASPICMPNRATLMTGRMPSLHGVRNNGIPLSLDQHTFVEVLRAGGYATALIGKGHLQNMIDAPPIAQPRFDPPGTQLAGFSEARRGTLDGERYEQESPRRWHDPTFEVSTPYYGFDRAELATEHGDLVDGAYRRWLIAHGGDPPALAGPAAALPSSRPYRVPQAWRTRVPEELYPTTFVAERTIAYLEQHAAAGGQQPFFIQCSFPDPHHPFTPPGRYWDMYDPDDMTAPATCHAPGDAAPPNLRWMHEQRASGAARTDTPAAFAIDAGEAREAIALTYGMISMIDGAVGRVLASLERLGLAGDTIVVFTSDHGDFMGDHGLLLKGPLHYRGLVRVPFIWVDPRAGGVANATRDGLAGTLDIAQTMLDVAGFAGYNGMQGHSLLPMIAGHAPLRDAMIVEEDGQRAMFGLREAPRVRTLITPAARMSVYAEAAWGELYNLEQDPNESENRWADVPMRAEYLELLAHATLELGDRSPAPTRRA
jgi:arylsulfatase A-like enzyme